MNLCELYLHQIGGQLRHRSDLTERMVTIPVFDAAVRCPVKTQKARHAVT